MIILDIIGKKTKYMSSVVNHAAAKSAAAILHFLGSAFRHLSFLNVYVYVNTNYDQYSNLTFIILAH